MKRNQHGFSVLWLGLLILIMAVTGIVGWRIYDMRSSTTISSSSAGAVLTGTVTEGPTAPICRSGESCTRAVSSHTIEALDASGNVAATTTTDDSGRYTLQLKPGRYTLTLVPRIGFSNAADNKVDVKAGTTTHDLAVDTGIR